MELFTIGGGCGGARILHQPAGRWQAARGCVAALLAAAPLLVSGQALADPVVRSGEARACAGTPGEVRLRIQVAGVRNSAGTVTVTVYGDQARDFLASGRKLARVRVPAATGTVGHCLAVPARPAYAIAVYHDENNDRDFNRTLVGLPAEGFGFSNDAPTSLGLPRFEAARFTAPPGDTEIRITLRY